MEKLVLRGLEMAGGTLIRDPSPKKVLGAESVVGAVYADRGPVITQKSKAHLRALTDARVQFESVDLAFECSAGFWRVYQAIRGLRHWVGSTV